MCTNISAISVWILPSLNLDKSIYFMRGCFMKELKHGEDPDQTATRSSLILIYTYFSISPSEPTVMICLILTVLCQ